jgi:prepilin-type N-terminal cleavage/methylation domain-containing protein
MNNALTAKFREESGLTLVEILVVLLIAGILVAGVGGIVGGALDLWDSRKSRQELVYQAEFAMDRIVNAVTRTERLLIPLADNPGTLQDESLRDVLAVTLDPTLDRDADGFADADNDKDGKVDEDIPSDNTNDGVAGIIGMDEDNNGILDEGNLRDNDEDANQGDDWLDGVDNDGDGSIDEDIPRINDQSSPGVGTYDNDGDGSDSEDWLDPVVYFISADGKSLVERLPDVNPVDGTDYTERSLAEADSVTLAVSRASPGPGERNVLLDITLQLVEGDETVTLQSQVRVGGGM